MSVPAQSMARLSGGRTASGAPVVPGRAEELSWVVALLGEGFGKREIARRTAVLRASVRRIAKRLGL